MRTTRLISVVAFFGGNLAFLGCGDDVSTTGTGAGGQGGGTTTTSAMTTTTTSVTTTSTGGNGTGGSGGSAQFTDACPPEILTVDLGSATTVSGSTATATSGFSTYCADTAGTTADVVIGLDVTAPCTLELNLNDAALFDGVLSIRKQQCDSRLGGDDCRNYSTDNEVSKFHADAGTYYVVVDGANGSTGAFSLSISCSAPACGDGIVDAPEECDTGPGATPNDGCADVGAVNECRVEAQLASPTCPGTPLSIDLNTTSYFPASSPTYNTSGSGDDYDNDGTCSQETEEVEGTGAAEQVFEITPTSAGTLTVRTVRDGIGTSPCSTFDAFCVNRLLYIRSGTCAAGTQIACAGTAIATTLETIVSTPVIANVPYYLFVDSYWDQSEGPYALEVKLEP